MRETAAEDAAQCLSNLPVGCMGLRVQKRLGREDHATETVATLRCSLFEESLLDGVRLSWRAQAFQRCNRSRADAAHRFHTGADNLRAHHYRAGATLRHATAEVRPIQMKLIRQYK